MKTPNTTLGLRVDVDTYRGTREGVPRLLEILARRGLHASFFFSVGPDNMGRHLWRLLKPQFLLKMLRSHAASLYGWDILLKGAFWPGPNIGERLSEIIRATGQAGHEVGLHAWDHQRWQARALRMSVDDLTAEHKRGVKALNQILDRPVQYSAAAGWICNDEILKTKESEADFTYHSDCRGHSLFCPVIEGTRLTPQIPVTLPTYDELIHRNGLTDDHYNAHLISLIKPGQLNVLAIHAEVEGGIKWRLFVDFIEQALAQGIRLRPLGALLPANTGALPDGKIELVNWPGREGLIAQQVKNHA